MSTTRITTPHFPVWKTIKVGTHKSVADLEAATLNAGFRIGDWAHDVLTGSAFTLAEHEFELNLVRLTVGELGFKDGAHRTNIYKRALELGLKLCPLEVGPQLRLQYSDQPKLGSLQIAMKPQRDSEGHESQFRVVHGGDGFAWLVGDHKHPDDFWKENEYFIFVK